VKWNSPKPYIQGASPTLEPVRHVDLPIATCYRAVRILGSYLKYKRGLSDADYADLINAQNSIDYGRVLLEGVETRRTERTDKGDS